MRPLLFAALLLASQLVSTLTAQNSAPPETGVARAERLLAAMGGRDAWARVRWVHVQAVHDDLDQAQPFNNYLWNDFSRLRLRFEAHNSTLDRCRVVDGNSGWRWADGKRIALTTAQAADEQPWWEANIYRTLQRLAARDPGLEARAVGAHRLEIFRSDGKRLNWFVLHPSGAPMLFGTWDSEAGTVFGPLGKAGELRYPKWGGRPDGSWRYEIVRFQAEAGEPAAEVFESTEKLGAP
ncbi:MAG: hypothetical protein JSR82_14250 [Verrucomicrobia bacterium]|nr:hypothetical protein [Verrucomicrobiota bacterium]